MAVGKMNIKGALQNNVGVSKKDNYQEVLICWGELKKSGGSRGNEVNETVLNSAWTWTVRFSEDLETNINKSSRWVIQNRFFTITSYEIVDQKRFYYKFNLTERE